MVIFLGVVGLVSYQNITYINCSRFVIQFIEVKDVSCLLRVSTTEYQEKHAYRFLYDSAV
jgi:hypothetical protein